MGAAGVCAGVAPGNINGAEGDVSDCAAADIMGGCWGAAGYLNAENAPGVAIPVGLGDPNIGGVLVGTAAGADIDAGKWPGVGRKNAGEDVLVGLGEPAEGEAFTAVVIGWGCEKIGVLSMSNLKAVVSGAFVGTGTDGSTLKVGGS